GRTAGGRDPAHLRRDRSAALAAAGTVRPRSRRQRRGGGHRETPRAARASLAPARRRARRSGRVAQPRNGPYRHLRPRPRRRRQQLGLAPLERDKALDEAARKGIQNAAFRGSVLSRAEQGATVRALLEHDRRFESAAAETYVVSSPDEISSQNAAEGSWGQVGIGALYKSSEAYGPGRLWVLIVFAR